MADSFDQVEPITLQPGSATVPYTFTFAAASSATANDGSIPFGTTISSAVIKIYDESGTDRTSEIVVSESNTATVLTINLRYPVTAELMPNQVDRDFSGASAWTNVDIDAYDEAGDLTITANAIGQYCTCPVASAPTTIGKRYRMTYDLANIVSSWEVQSFDGTQTIGIIDANATTANLEWTARTTGGYRIVSVAANSSGDFDNFSLKDTGSRVGRYSIEMEATLSTGAIMEFDFTRIYAKDIAA